MAIMVRHGFAEDYPALMEVARTLRPVWFTETALKEIAESLQKGEIFVALAGETIAGFAICTITKDPRTVEISWMGVRPKDSSTFWSCTIFSSA